MKKLFLIFCFVPYLIFAQTHSGQDYFKQTSVVYFSFEVSSKEELNKFSKIVSIDHGSSINDVKAFASEKEFTEFLKHNIPFKILEQDVVDPNELNMLLNLHERSINDWDFYPSYEVYVEMMYSFQEQHPQLCRVSSFGYTEQGRELLIAKLGDNIDVEEGEPRLLFTSSMHGDEISGYVLSLRLIDYLLKNYNSDDRINSIMRNVEIWINPLANPDGAYFFGNNTVAGARRYNANNVDLNRNFPDPQDGMHPDGNPYQTETLAFMDLADSCEFDISSNFHGGVEVANYPWDTWTYDTADIDWWLHVMRSYADTAQTYGDNGYFNFTPSGITNGYDWYEVDGGRQDYMNFEHRCREFTLEISDEKIPAGASLPYYWDASYRSFLGYMEQSTYGLHGSIKDSITLEPLKAKVFIDGHDIDSSHVYSHLPLGDYHRYLYAGNYNLTFSATGYTSKTLNCNIYNNQRTNLDVELVPVGLSLKDPEWMSDIKISPQPTSDIIDIQFTKKGDYSISVFDINGSKIEEHHVLNSNQVSLLIQHLNSGAYLLNINNGKSIFSKEIIKL